MPKCEQNEMNFPKSLRRLNVDKYEPLDITPPAVKRMTGATFLPNRDLVVCDFESKAVIVLDREFKERSRLAMPDRAWGASVLDENKIIVSLTNLKRLQIVEVVPVLALKSSIKVGMECFDVKVIGTTVYVVCTKEEGWGELRVLDMDGNVMNRLGIRNGSNFLKHPIHMTTNYTQDKINEFLN